VRYVVARFKVYASLSGHGPCGQPPSGPYARKSVSSIAGWLALASYTPQLWETLLTRGGERSPGRMDAWCQAPRLIGQHVGSANSTQTGVGSQTGISF